MGSLGLVAMVCSNPRAQNRPIKEMAALQQLYLMTSTYLSKKGLSYLVELMGGQNGGRGRFEF